MATEFVREASVNVVFSTSAVRADVIVQAVEGSTLTLAIAGIKVDNFWNVESPVSENWTEEAEVAT